MVTHLRRAAGAAAARAHRAQDDERLVGGRRATIGENLLHGEVGEIAVHQPGSSAEARVSSARARWRDGVGAQRGPFRINRCSGWPREGMLRVTGQWAEDAGRELNEVQQGLHQNKIVAAVKRCSGSELITGSGPDRGKARVGSSERGGMRRGRSRPGCLLLSASHASSMIAFGLGSGSLDRASAR